MPDRTTTNKITDTLSAGAEIFYSLIETPIIYGNNLIFSALEQIDGPVGAIAEWAKVKRDQAQLTFAPNEQQKLLQRYANSYTLSDVAPAIELCDKFLTCFEARALNISSFDALTLTDETRFSQQFNDADATHHAQVEAVKVSLNQTLVPDELLTLEKKYKVIKKLIKSNKSFNPQALNEEITKLDGQANIAFNTQLKKDKERIENLFNNNPDANFTVNLTQTLTSATNPVPNLNKIKQDMLKTIEEKHTSALETFQKDATELKEKLKKAAEKAAYELQLITILHKHASAALKAKIQAIHAKAQAAEDGNLVIAQDRNQDDAGDELHGVTLDGLELHGVALDGLLGKECPLEYNTNTKSFSIKKTSYLPGFLSSLEWSHYSPENQRLADFKLIALATKAKGHEKIIMRIQGPTTQEGSDRQGYQEVPSYKTMRTARDAYKACRLMGWAEDKITLNVNGKDMSIAEVFNNYENRKELIEKKAEKYQASRDTVAAKLEQASSRHFKQQVTKLQTEIEEEDREAGIVPRFR